MQLTKQENEQVKECIRQIDKYVKELQPLREKFKNDIYDKEFDISFHIQPTSNEAYITVGYSSYLLDESKKEKWLGHSTHAIKLIDNWSVVKKNIVNHVQKEKQTLNTLYTFTV